MKLKHIVTIFAIATVFTSYLLFLHAFSLAYLSGSFVATIDDYGEQHIEAVMMGLSFPAAIYLFITNIKTLREMKEDEG